MAGSAAGSQAFPGVRTKPPRRPTLSVSAAIFVVSPPRMTPMAACPRLASGVAASPLGGPVPCWWTLTEVPSTSTFPDPGPSRRPICRASSPGTRRPGTSGESTGRCGPVAELGGQIPPGGASAGDPEDGSQNGAGVVFGRRAAPGAGNGSRQVGSVLFSDGIGYNASCVAHQCRQPSSIGN